MGTRGGSLPGGLEEVAALTDDEHVRAFRTFLENYHGESVEALLLAEDTSRWHPLDVQYCEFLDSNPPLANLMYFRPKEMLSLFDDALRESQVAALEVRGGGRGMTVKENVHVRLDVRGSAFQCPETRPNIGRVGVRHVGRLVTLRGIIIRYGARMVLEASIQHECAQCKFRFHIKPELEMGYSVEMPTTCPSQEQRACWGKKFPRVEDAVPLTRDYQEIKILESMHELRMGSMPRSIVVVLEDDLVDAAKPGDEVMVTGWVFNKWCVPNDGARCNLELMLFANHVMNVNERETSVGIPPSLVERFEDYWRHHSDTPFVGRNTILRNVCPQMHGLFVVKLAVVLALIGGVERVEHDGTRLRGRSHLLLLGDPGTGKSQFLKYASKLSHRSVFTTGTSTSGAGLTVTAIKDKEGGGWALEAGALVMADGGVCCIDEFDRMAPADRSAMLEAMEQQTVSVAKAGHVTKLNTRTTVLGAINPKGGRYDPTKHLSGPLLSRFDVVLVLLDVTNPHWDRDLSSRLLSEQMGVAAPGGNGDGPHGWNLQTLRSYIRYVRNRFKPKLNPQAVQILERYYRQQRGLPSSNAERTTARLLEGLIRLTEAHARLMFRGDATRADAIAAIVCVESSMGTSAVLEGERHVLHAGFPDDPEGEYLEQEGEVLSKLRRLSRASAP